MSDTTKKYTGYIEKSKYINSELVKAVDIVVDELINKPYKDKILTIAKSKYDDLSLQLTKAINDFVLKNEEYLASLSIIENLKSEIELYKQQLDAEKILTAVANNETQASNERYASLLSDFQTSITKGVQEAIARVSLEAQVRGLQAQKEVLMAQQSSLQSQLSGAQAASTAAAAGLLPGANSNFYYKLSRNDGKDWSTLYTWTTSMNNYTSSNLQFAKLSIQNLNDDAGQLITKVQLKLTGDLLNYGPIGFTNAPKPADTTVVDITQGKTSQILLYAGSTIGGRADGSPAPLPGGWFSDSSSKDYKGTIQVIVTYSNGTTEAGDALAWSIRKNKG